MRDEIPDREKRTIDKAVLEDCKLNLFVSIKWQLRNLKILVFFKHYQKQESTRRINFNLNSGSEISITVPFQTTSNFFNIKNYFPLYETRFTRSLASSKQKIKFSIRDFFSKRDWPTKSVKKFLMKNFFLRCDYSASPVKASVNFLFTLVAIKLIRIKQAL